MMKKITLLTLSTVILLAGSCRQAKRYHDEVQNPMDSIKEEAILDILRFHEELNEQFRDAKNSPLSDKYRQDFKKLDFFEPDTVFRVMAYLERTPEALPFLMPTTTERTSTERVFGIARFRLGKRDFQLELYQNPEHEENEEYKDYLFLPFTDNTNGTTTYAGGRYIDLAIPETDSILLDFNKAYNPYCAYNKKYSCPLVPKVNHLDIEINAGVKRFKKKGS